MPIGIGLGLSPVLPDGARGTRWSPAELSSLRAWYDAELGQPRYGGDGAYVQLDGTSGDYIYTPDSAATSFSNDIEVVMRVNVTDWTAAANQTLAGKYVSTGNQRSWRFYVNTSGAIGLTASADGTAVTSVIVTPTNALPDATWIWLRMRLDLTNGSNSVGTLETATDTGNNTEPSSWTANGTNTGTTISGIFDSTSPTEIGAFGSGTLERLTGQVGRCIVRSGFAGTTVVDFNASDCYGDGYWHSGGYRWNLGLPKIYDRSGNNHPPAVFGAGSNQPVWLPWEGQAQVYLPGAAGNYLRCPRVAAHALADDIEIVLSVVGVTGRGVTQTLHSSETGSSDRHWRLQMTTTDGLRFAVFPDGTTASESAVLSSVPLPDWARWLKVTRRRSDGRTQFFVSSDDGEVEPSAWSQLGVDGFAAAGAAMHTATSSAYLEIGSRFAGVTEATAGFVRRFILRNGIDGSTVADFVASSCSQTGYTDPLGNAWIALRSTSGRKTVVQSPVARSARSVILFGTDDWASAPAAAAPSLGLSDNATVTAAVRQHATAAAFRWYWAITSGIGTELMSMQQRTTNFCKSVFSDGVNTIDSSPSPAFTNGTMTVVGARVQARTAYAAYVNGGSPATQSPAAVGALTPAAFTIGALAPASAVQEFEFGALLVRTVAESDTEHGLQVAYYGGGL